MNLTPAERRVLVELDARTFDPRSAKGQRGAARNAMLWRLLHRDLVELSPMGGTFVITDSGRKAVKS